VINDVTKQHLGTHLNKLQWIDNMQHGLTAEQAIRLAHSNPAFRTLYSLQIENEQYFVELNEVQKLHLLFWLLEELSIVEEAERAEFFNQLKLSYEWQKVFDELIDEEAEFELFLQKERERQIDSLNQEISRLLALNTNRIIAIDSQIKELSVYRSSIEREVLALNTRANSLMLQAWSHVKLNDYTMMPTEQTSKILTENGTMVRQLKVERQEIFEYFNNYIHENASKPILMVESDYREQLKVFLMLKLKDQFRHLPQAVQDQIITQEMQSPQTAAMIDNLMKDINQSFAKSPHFKEANELKVAVILKTEELKQIDSHLEVLEAEKAKLAEANKVLQKCGEELQASRTEFTKPLDDIAADLFKQLSKDELANLFDADKLAAPAEAVTAESSQEHSPFKPGR
jgi:hypothetical protein